VVEGILGKEQGSPPELKSSMTRRLSAPLIPKRRGGATAGGRPTKITGWIIGRKTRLYGCSVMDSDALQQVGICGAGNTVFLIRLSQLQIGPDGQGARGSGSAVGRDGSGTLGPLNLKRAEIRLASASIDSSR